MGLSQYVNESMNVNLANFSEEIESLNKKFTKYTLMYLIRMVNIYLFMTRILKNGIHRYLISLF